MRVNFNKVKTITIKYTSIETIFIAYFSINIIDSSLLNSNFNTTSKYRFTLDELCLFLWKAVFKKWLFWILIIRICYPRLHGLFQHHIYFLNGSLHKKGSLTLEIFSNREEIVSKNFVIVWFQISAMICSNQCVFCAILKKSINLRLFKVISRVYNSVLHKYSFILLCFEICILLPFFNCVKHKIL